MNNTDSILSLINIQIHPQNSADGPNVEELKHSDFNDRSDFLFFKKIFNIHLRLSFMNESQFSSKCVPKGVRRMLSIALIDLEDNRVIATSQTNLYIRAEEAYHHLLTTLTLPDDSIVNPAHTHSLIIRDTNSKTILGEKTINFFKLNTIRLLPTKWYIPDGGFVCLKSDRFFTPHLSLYAEGNSQLCIVFKLKPQYAFPAEKMPEVEIRVYGTDGVKYTSTLCRPIHHSLETDVVTAEMQFNADTRNRGVRYAELLVTGYRVCGFVFCTTGLTIKGKWTGEQLAWIADCDNFNLGQVFDKRLSAQLSNIKDCTASSDGDVTGHMLDGFVSQQSDDNEPRADDYPTDNNMFHNATRQNLLSALDHLIGLDDVKAKLKTYSNTIMFNKMRSQSNLPTLPLPLHSMFLGSPGTGKTTVAKLMGQLLAEAGILSKGHVVVRERATLVGQYYSSESQNILNAIEEAKGGILLIDEAYQLYQPEDPRDPGKFVIESLLTSLSDSEAKDWMLILAGYPEPMRKMFEMNPGFKSRIPDSNIYRFEDFSCGQLIDVARNYLERHSFKMSDKATYAIKSLIESQLKTKDETFGNARYIENLIQTGILPAMADRLSGKNDITIEDLITVEACDIPSPTMIVNYKPRPLGFRA